jgi:hypothetical protein
MPETSEPAQGQGALEMRLWVPAEGGLRRIASELATRIAEYLGITAPDTESIGAMVEGLASRLGHGGTDQGSIITFDFRKVGRELVIEASCSGHASELRHPLPA